MNRGLNLPAIQRIMNEFERESATMDMKEDMMSEAVDDAMDNETEDEEEEGDKILKEVLDEIGVTLQQQVGGWYFHKYACQQAICSIQLSDAPAGTLSAPITESRQAVAIGEHGGPPASSRNNSNEAPNGSGGFTSEEDALQARLDNLRRT